MTPQQQSALESVVGRTLTGDEITAIDPLLDPNNRNDVAIAAILSEGRVRLKSHEIGIGTVLGVMAPDGGAFLDTLETIGASDSNVKWLLKLIERGAFDVGLPASRAQMTAYAQAVPALADGINALLALGVEQDPIHYNKISDALNIAENRMTL
jgi:hypothetical protein